jgi:OTU domain-containing protein 5
MHKELNGCLLLLHTIELNYFMKKAKDEAHFSQFLVDENFWDYICRKRENGIHGNNPEIQAISELFNRPVEVFVPENGGKTLAIFLLTLHASWVFTVIIFLIMFPFACVFVFLAEPINIFHEEYKTADVPIRLSYHDGNHYNAVIDPLCPTAGLGLGLPGLEPGLADRLQVEKAKRESDELADKARFEKAMEESHRELMQKAIKESAMESTMSVDHVRSKSFSCVVELMRHFSSVC